MINIVKPYKIFEFPLNANEKVIFFHNNARSHSAKKAQDLQAEFKRDIFDHPSDFHLFPRLNVHSSGQRFVINDVVKVQ